MDKLFLLDAYALIYRSYYAFMKAPRINSKGLNTSCVIELKYLAIRQDTTQFCKIANDILGVRIGNI